MLRRIIATLVLVTSTLQAQVMMPLGESVFRFDASGEAKANALPSMSFKDPSHRETQGESKSPARTTPVFDRDDQGRVRVTIHIEPGTSLYGTGEVPGPLLRNGHVSVNWNTDAYGYGADSPSLYQAHPWVLAVRADGSAFGVLADTTYRTELDLRDDIVITAAGPEFPVIIIERPHPELVVRALASITGPMPMPPKWALGYHQCRYSYYPDSRVREIASEFRTRKIPCDVIWMDIDYMDGFRCFTFSPEHFPDPAGLNADLHAQGFHTVWMIDPGIKAEPGYSVYDSGTAIDAWVKQSDQSTPYKGEVWPGECVFPDFTNQAVRDWWAGLYKDFLATGIDGVWNDMNEPAVFGVPTKTMPEDNWHRADEAFGGPGPHARFHNVYGMLMIQATHEGVLAANPDKRPFVLSRANFIGGHRYGASWTGDNVAAWDHLEWSVPMALNLTMSGQPFCGPDIGGFADNGDARLYARWIGIGTLLPFARGHTGKGNIDKEPWAFGPEVEATARRAIQRRYVLMPYLYTLFARCSTSGVPIIMPLFFVDPTDPALRSEDDAFLLGDSLLVKCNMTPDRDRQVAMPSRGIWRRFDLRDAVPGDHLDPNLPELYIRGGAIIPTAPVMQYVDQTLIEPLTLYVSLDHRNEAQGGMYEDAGDGFDHEKGKRRAINYSAKKVGPRVTIWRRVDDGDWPRHARSLRVILVTDDGMYLGQGLDGEEIVIDVTKAKKIGG